MSASDDAIVSFCAVSGASADVAQSFVSSANGDVELAISNYFEAQAAGGIAPAPRASAQAGEPDADDAAAIAAAMAEDEPGPSTVAAAPATGGARTLDGRPADPLPADWARRAGVGPAAGSGPPQRRTGLGTLGSRADDDDDEDDGAMDEDEDDEVGPPDAPQDLYAGGERSGLNVQDPNARPGGSNRLVRDLLKKAAENSEKREADTKAAAKPSAFRGTGNTLGSEDEPSRVVPDPTAPPPRNRMPGAFGVGAGEDDDEEGGASAPEETVTRVLTFWKDGFSIDDGPLLKYEDHKETLKALNEGRAPLELLNVRFGQRVDVQIANRPQEMYRPPPPKPMKAFGGSGNRLGAPTPELAGSPAASSSETPPVRSTGAAPPPSRTVFEVNPNEPVTQIQIRLGDGQRLVAKFNHTHTVGDIIAYINNAHPSNASRPYVLQTTFPNRDLTDPSQTLKDANLLGTVIVQRFS